MAQGDDIIPIPGTKKIKYLEENLGALGVKVSAEEEKEIRSLVDTAEVYGLRYPEAIVGWFVCFYSRFGALDTDKSRYSFFFFFFFFFKKSKAGQVSITTHLQHPLSQGYQRPQQPSPNLSRLRQ